MKSLSKKDHKRRQAVRFFEFKRIKYKSILSNQSFSPLFRNVIQSKLNKLPRSSSRTQIKNRCIVTGRCDEFWYNPEIKNSWSSASGINPAAYLLNEEKDVELLD